MVCVNCSNEKGRSMVEMLGVLAIIGVLSTAGIAGYTKAMEKFKINTAANQISTIISNYNTLMLNSPNKNDLYNERVINQLVLPVEMLHEGKCYHALNGRCSVGHNLDPTKDEFVIRFGDLSKDLCVNLLSLPVTESALRITINKNAPGATLGSGGGKEFKGAVNISKAAELCYEKDNTICWVF
ncbi:MAG: hypothetical protein IJZ59_07465 [Alphaproteobacteria bacterium]|nr:hypothetical protein [Alphaproteobacteria bacterium]